MPFLNRKKGTKYSQKVYLKRYRRNCRLASEQKAVVRFTYWTICFKRLVHLSFRNTSSGSETGNAKARFRAFTAF